MRIVHIALLAVVAAALVFVLGSGTPSEGHLRIGNAELTIEVADERSELTQGLSDRDELPADHAMLFMFPADGMHGMWMKDMHFPIDIVWFDEDWRAVDVREHVSPETYPEVFYPASESRYVLELAAGMASQYGIAIGSVIQR